MRGGAEFPLTNILKRASVLCLVDGEHYPPVIQAALQRLRSEGAAIKGLFFLGGTEKIENPKEAFEYLGGKVQIYHSGELNEQDMLSELAKAIRACAPELLVDLSDEPVLDYRLRFRLISHSLRAGASYYGSDFFFRAPARTKLLDKQSIAIIGSGKRVGKTAVCIYTARLLKEAGMKPVIVTMGRGGPSEPVLLEPSESDAGVRKLLSVAEEGRHAASDYWEDFSLAGVPTIGCRRCGGGMSGSPFISNVREGISIAASLEGGPVLFEGSGPTIPPVHADRTVLVVGANEDIENVCEYLGEYRLLLADLVIITKVESLSLGSNNLRALKERIASVNPNINYVLTSFKPEPEKSIEGKNIFLASTAGERQIDRMISHLEEEHACRVRGFSAELSNREELRKDLDRKLADCDILLTEIKAASIDLAAEYAEDLGKEIVFFHNKPVYEGGTLESLDNGILDLLRGTVVNDKSKKR